MAKEIDPLGLFSIAPNTWFIPGERDRSSNDTDPTLILLFSWMEAKPVHVSKYSAGYRALFPTADQLIVASTTGNLAYPATLLKRRLLPVVEKLRSLGVVGETTKPHRVLTQTMSNGGTSQLRLLCELLAQEKGAHKCPSALVVDSAPGGDNVESGLYVFKGLFSPPFHYVAFFTIIAVHNIWWALGQTEWMVFDSVRQTLLGTRLPWAISDVKSTPQLYIYSKADIAVPFNEIQSHTEVAESKGIPVTRQIYETSGHVSHMRQDPDRYWSSIRSHWEKVIKF